MSTLEISKFEQWVTEIADEYRRKGYEVLTHPPDEHLPDFLIPFKPDLIAQSSLEKVAIRVQASGRVRRTDSLTELAEAVEAHPGWRLDLAIERPQERDKPDPDEPRIEKAVIRQRLQEGEQLLNQGLLDAALLIIWSALEAACWWAFRKEKLRLERNTPAAYVSRLYSELFVDEDEFRHLKAILELRNAIAHGVQGAEVQNSDIQKILKIARRLIGRKD